MPDLRDLNEDIVVVAGEREELRTTYFDTEDLRLARWGMSLRYRVGEGWTLKLPAGGDGHLLIRGEYTFPGAAGHPAKGAVDLARACVRTAQLKPVTRLHTLRRRVQLLDADGTLLADVADDEVSVLPGRRIAARFRELEVEVTDAMPGPLLERVIDLLRTAGAAEPDPTPKYIRAVGPAAMELPEVVVEDLPTHASAGDVLRRAISASVVQLLRNDPVMRLDEDSEGVHRARVATRRLRSHLRTFSALLDPEWAVSLRDELGWLGGVLGTTRDADVLLERMQGRVADLPENDGRGADELLEALADSRAKSHRALMKALRDERYFKLLDRLVTAAHEPRLGGAPGQPASSVLPMVLEQWKSIRRLVKSSHRPRSDEELHRIRIHAKRCRYAAEAVAPLVGKRAHAFASSAADIQTVLGEHHDAVVAARWLREWSLERSSQAAFCAGALAAAEWASARRARRGWRRVWKTLTKRRPSGWT